MNNKNLINKLISEELRALRAKKGLSQIDVASETGFNKDTICRYESNESNVKIYILAELLSFYDSNLKIFFTNIYDRMQNIKQE